MYRNARIYVADMLDQIVVEATVFSSDWTADEPAQVNTFRAQCNSTGRENEHEWIRDALVALLETL